MEAQKQDEISNEFRKADEKFDKIIEQSRVRVQDKRFMTISDVDPEDARKFKEFCDKHTDRKQFLGIKLLMMLADKLDPILENVLKQLNNHEDRLLKLESRGEEQSSKPKLNIPVTQGRNLRG